MIAGGAVAPEPGSGLPTDDPVLRVEGLRTRFTTGGRPVPAVDGVSFTLRRGETLGLVGESGCGKSVSALSLLRLVPSPPGEIVAGSVVFSGRDLLALPAAELQRIRGNEISMIFQEPMTSLNPVMTIGHQIAEAITRHRGLSSRAARDHAAEMLDLVRLSDPRRRLGQYPHQLSGGMRQRVMIAMALACNPRALIADEPTTALDVTVQAQILDLLRELQARLGTAILLITHDLGVVAQVADRVLVMYAGRIVEEAEAGALFAAPRHPYTHGLLASMPYTRTSGRTRPGRLSEVPGTVPRLGAWPAGCAFAPRCSFALARCESEVPALEEKRPRHRAACWAKLPLPAAAGLPSHAGAAREDATAVPSGTPLLEVRGLKTWFRLRRGLRTGRGATVKAVDGLSFTIRTGETLGLVGESGCGKSTVGKTVLRLIEPTAGRILVEGQDVTHLDESVMRPLRRRIQMVFQDAYSSLNPRVKAGAIVAEPLRVHRLGSPTERRARVAALFERVGLHADQMDHFPHQFSGGQRQRIGIARALALNPKLILCDEPVSALDMSIQAQVINLMQDLQDQLGLSYLFISHDLGVVEHISHRVAVMYLGRIVELAERATLFGSPRHPYTEALLAAIPVPDPRAARAERPPLAGEVPSPLDPPAGCRFHPRCPLAEERCRREEPTLDPAANGALVACHLRS